jgi:hypothetical protein
MAKQLKKRISIKCRRSKLTVTKLRAVDFISYAFSFCVTDITYFLVGDTASPTPT